jgi:hypothetical protein
MKLNYLGLPEGGLITEAISCLDCLEKGSECDQCVQLPAFKSPGELQVALGLPVVEGEEEDGCLEVTERDVEETVEADSEDDTDGEEEETEETEDDIDDGCFGWAPFGRRFYPGQAVSLASVPHHLHRQLITKKSGQVIVKWIGEVDSNGEPVNRCSSFATDRLKLMGDSACEHSLAKRYPMKYYEALNQAPTPT